MEKIIFISWFESRLGISITGFGKSIGSETKSDDLEGGSIYLDEIGSHIECGSKTIRNSSVFHYTMKNVSVFPPCLWLICWKCGKLIEYTQMYFINTERKEACSESIMNRTLYNHWNYFSKSFHPIFALVSNSKSCCLQGVAQCIRSTPTTKNNQTYVYFLLTLWHFKITFLCLVEKKEMRKKYCSAMS